MKRSIVRLAALLVASHVLATAARAGDPLPIYRAIREARPDGRQIDVSGLVLKRDAFTFTFASGVAHLLAPVEGRTIGAVFLGAMTYIGNGPNFMVKAIADSSGVRMPSFFGYLVYAIAVLVPVLAIVGFLTI